MRGLFLTFEGIEGCGKSTQSKLLSETLRATGHPVLWTREPGGPVISEKIRELLLDPIHTEMQARTELLLYLASRAQHTGEWIVPALERGEIVICDRYTDSSLAYQGFARSLGPDLVRELNRFATADRPPDHTFLLDLPVEEGLRRIACKHPDRLESESADFHRQVRQGFLHVAKQEPERFSIIDAMREISLVQREILDITENLIQGNRS